MKDFSFGNIERIIMEQAERDFRKMQAKRLGEKVRKPRVKGVAK